MRFSIKKYEAGQTYAVETNDDGSEIVSTLIGQREVGQRISAFVEVLADDTPAGADRLLEALAWLAQQIEARKAKEQGARPKGKTRTAT